MKKLLWMLCAFILCFSCKAEVHAEEVSAWQEEIRERMETATAAYQGQVYIDDLQIPVSDENEEALDELCDTLLEEIASCYYVYSVSFVADASYTYYSKIAFRNNVSFERLVAYDNVVADALSYISPEMSDLEKAVVLYGYLLRRCEYDYAGTYENSSYGALVNGITQCQGYATAYMELLSQVGIEAKFVRSTPMDHGWCLVKIDGSWYHADPTWDDDNSGENRFGFTYFMLSDAEMGATHYDWMTYYLPEVGADGAFEDCIFRDMEATSSDNGLFYYGGVWYYVGEDGDIYSSDIWGNNLQKCLDGENLEYVHFLKDKVYLVDSNGIYMADGYDFDALTAVETWENAYPDNDPSGVYSVEVTGDTLTVKITFSDITGTAEYTLDISESKAAEQTGYIVAFESDCRTVIAAEKDVKAGSLLEEPQAPSKDGYTFMGWYLGSERTTAWDFATDTVEGNFMLYAKWKPNTISLQDDDVFISTGKTTYLYLTEEVPGNTYVWESGDESIATVNQNGLIQGVSKGKTTIKVYLQEDPSVYAICQLEITPKCSIMISPYWTELYIYWGGQQSFTASVSKATTEDTTITWASQDESIVQVEDGVITGVGHGTANVIVEAPGTDANPLVLTVEVAENYSLDVNYGKEEYTLNVGDKEEVIANGWSRLQQEYVPEESIVWTSANEGVAKYEDGYIVAVGAGETTITVEIPGTDAEPAVLKVTVWGEDGPVSTATPAPTATPVSPEQRAQVTAFVERMYTVALGRESDPSGVEWWTEQLLAKTYDGASLSVGFIMSEEFIGMNYSNDEFIQILYSTFFDRDADDGGKAYWSGILENGSSRAEVLVGFVNSNEFFEICGSYGISRGVLRSDGSAVNPGIYQFSERLYSKVLERSGDKEGIEYWSLQIDSKASTPEDAAMGFFFSGEYLNKQTTDTEYVMALYRTFMDREADDIGLSYWNGALEGGTTREHVLSSFAYSDEFKGIMAEYGL